MVLLITHIVSALSSLALAAVAYLWPSKLRLRIDMGLAGVTLLTGIYLVWTNPKDLVSSCISGITYLAIVLTGIYAAGRKLARTEVTE
jgi:hypothetical protein